MRALEPAAHITLADVVAVHSFATPGVQAPNVPAWAHVIDPETQVVI